MSWQEHLKIHAEKDKPANGFRILGLRAGKATSDEGKKEATAAANEIFHW